MIINLKSHDRIVGYYIALVSENIGSNPIRGSNIYASVAKLVHAARLDRVSERTVSSNLTRGTRIAEMAEW